MKTGSQGVKVCMPLKAALITVCISLAAFLFNKFETKLIDAVPLNEITVEVKKRPDFTVHQWYCNNKYGKVTQAGPHLKCLRTDI